MEEDEEQGDTLHWDTVANASGYRLRWKSATSSWLRDVVSASQTSFDFSGLPLGVKYTIQARALAGNSNQYQNSRWSSTKSLTRTVTPTPKATSTNTPTPTPKATATVTAKPTATDAAPKDLQSPPNLRHVSGRTVAWDAVTGATRYRLRWSLPGGVRQFKTVVASPTQYTIAGLSLGILYEAQARTLGDGTQYEAKGPWSGVLQLQAAPAVTPSDTPAPTDTPTNTHEYTHLHAD